MATQTGTRTAPPTIGKLRSPRDRDVHVFKVRGRFRRWTVRWHGTEVFRELFPSCAAAVKAAKPVAKAKACELVVHSGRTGRISKKDSFGRDSKRRKG
jgi:hypothetical protein